MPIGLYPADRCVAGAIEIYNNIIDYSDEIIAVAEQMNRWRDATVFSSNNNTEVNIDIRSNKILDVNYDEQTSHPIFDEMNNIVRDYLLEYAENYKVGFKKIEPTQILKYSMGEEYQSHYDTGPTYPRVISALLYLNDVNYGGETEFTYFNLKVIPRAGRLVIFPSNYAYTHMAHPPTFGHKYVAVFWTQEIIDI